MVVVDSFLGASLQIQLAIGAGYLGYLSAYAGIRNHHRQIDIAFLTVSFGLVATIAATLTSPHMSGTLAIVCSSLAAIVAGLLWRKLGRRAMRNILRLGRIAYSDDDPSVLTAIWTDTAHNVSQVLVVLNDGREMLCDDTGKFRQAAIAPFIYGSDGSVGMYVTNSYRRDDKGQIVETVRADTRDDWWGDRMTIIPAESIRNVELRFQRKPQSSRLGGAVGGDSGAVSGL